jgi:hypothetical protein
MHPQAQGDITVGEGVTCDVARLRELIFHDREALDEYEPGSLQLLCVSLRTKW